LRVSHFQALYGRSCKTPIPSSDQFSMVLIGSEMLVGME